MYMALMHTFNAFALPLLVIAVLFLGLRAVMLLIAVSTKPR